jgi:hypothetical protein
MALVLKHEERLRKLKNYQSVIGNIASALNVHYAKYLAEIQDPEAGFDAIYVRAEAELAEIEDRFALLSGEIATLVASTNPFLPELRIKSGVCGVATFDITGTDTITARNAYGDAVSVFDRFLAADQVLITGFTVAADEGYYDVASETGSTITLDSSPALTNATGENLVIALTGR